ncbi:MAG TPA: hypothetical protein VHC21_00840 [Candidatus Saccharimonadales bacterium]|nr:hypothetical protein [Candidatus Saccharimonadales bacterium]
MLAEKYNLRKVLIWVLIGIFILFAAYKTYEYLTTGKVIVTTGDSNNYIKIAKAVSGGSTATIKQTQGKLSIRVKPGTYDVTVYSKSVADGTGQHITVNARRTSRISLKPAKALSPWLVYSQGASSVAANGSQLYFIDSSSEELMIAGDSGLARPFTNYSLSSAEWVKPGQGIAQSVGNSGGGLYIISGTSLSPLSLPFTPSLNGDISYGVSIDGTVYVSNGGDVYAGKLGSNLTKIYGSVSKNLGLAAGIGKVAVIAANQNSSLGSLVVVDDTGNVTKTAYTATQAEWAPDGKHLMVGGEGSNYILDGSLKKIGSAPVSSSSTVFAWQDNTHLLYTISNQLWVYDINAKTARQLTSLPTGSSISGIYPATDSPYIYFSVAAGDKNQLYKVSTAGQNASKTSSILSALMPDTVGVCTLNYLGFTTPTILTTYPQFQTSNDLCLEATKSELRYFKLDPATFQYVVTPVTTNKD